MRFTAAATGRQVTIDTAPTPPLVILHTGYTINVRRVVDNRRVTLQKGRGIKKKRWRRRKKSRVFYYYYYFHRIRLRYYICVYKYIRTYDNAYCTFTYARIRTTIVSKELYIIICNMYTHIIIRI